MKKFDTRWVTVPILSLGAYFIGDVSGWVIALVFVASFQLTLK